MKNRTILISLICLFLTGCVGLSSKGVFGTGVSVAFDPRSLGTQIDDSVMQKNLIGRLLLTNKSYLISVKTKVLDVKSNKELISPGLFKSHYSPNANLYLNQKSNMKNSGWLIFGETASVNF